MDAWKIFIHNMTVDTHAKRYYCKHCGVAIEPDTTNGRVRQYCSKQCADGAAAEKKREAKLSMVRKRSALARFEPAKVL